MVLQNFFLGNENVLKLMVAMNAKLCGYTKNHRSIHFKCVNCVVCKLDLNKAVKPIKKSTENCFDACLGSPPSLQFPTRAEACLASSQPLQGAGLHSCT